MVYYSWTHYIHGSRCILQTPLQLPQLLHLFFPASLLSMSPAFSNNESPSSTPSLTHPAPPAINGFTFTTTASSLKVTFPCLMLWSFLQRNVLLEQYCSCFQLVHTYSPWKVSFQVVWYTVQYMIWHDTTWCSMFQCDMIQYFTTRSDTTPYDTTGPD